MDTESQVPGISPDDVDEALRDLWRGRSGELERLLERPQGHTPGVDVLFGGAVAEGLARPAAESPPKVANYEVLRELGRGGMGVVYEARQRHPSRLVALKVIRAGHAPHSMQLKLFEREILSLARLRHPHIAAIYDAGITDDGRPYFAMELVQGPTLLEYVRTQSQGDSTEAQRIHTMLPVFERICETVSFAHQRGVIHRDLKPTNIIVCDDAPASGSSAMSASTSAIGPQVKVLDFGLARITDADSPDTMLTDAGHLRGTLAYMAPEQLQGDPADVDTRSDVYSLGVLLFEMLTGRMPYHIKGCPMGQVIRIICDTPPLKPSALNPALRGDIETIILKALAKDRAQRYTSASALAEDIARFRTDQPILARPASAAYQLRKFIARRRGAFVAGVALLVSIVAGLVTSTTLYVQASAARQGEERQRIVAQRVNRFLLDMLGSVDPRRSAGKDVAVLRELLDNASEQVSTTFADQPDIRGAIEDTLGQAYLSLGLYAPAEEHMTSAVAAFESAYGSVHRETLTAVHNLGIVMQDQGRPAEAEAVLRRALEGRNATLAPDHPDILATKSALGNLYREMNRLTEADQLLGQAVEGRTRVLGADHPSTLESMNHQAKVLILLKNPAAASELLQRVLAGQQAVLGPDHLDVLIAQNDLGLALKMQGRLEEAEERYRYALAGFERVQGEGHLDTLATRFNLAALNRDMNRLTEAETMLREGLEAAGRTLPEDHWYHAAFQTGLGNCLIKLNRLDEAEDLLDEAHARFSQAFPADHPWIARVLQARAELAKARESTPPSTEPEHPDESPH